ncbi:hypothetical protein GOB57_21890 [Sinorhizobium meliloti]|nr:hypothetical protein [Sinorhizobium meliloti]
MTVSQPTSKTIIIDTESYAGNFERELCAYATGQVSAGSYARGIVEAFATDIRHLEWWSAHIVHERDDDYGEVLVSLVPTPGWFNDGGGGHHRDSSTDTADAVAARTRVAHERAIGVFQRKLEIGDFDGGAWTREKCESEIQRRQQELAALSVPRTRCPAYLSVAIFVDEFPPAEVWDEFVERAKTFAENYPAITKSAFAKPFNITGFRKLEPQYDLEDGAVERPFGPRMF